MMTRHKGKNMALDRRSFAKSLSSVVGAMLAGTPARASAQAPIAASPKMTANMPSPLLIMVRDPWLWMPWSSGKLNVNQSED
jgi:hypothetical protein